MPAKVESGVFSIPNRTQGNPVQRSRRHVPDNLGVHTTDYQKNIPFGALLSKEYSAQGLRSIILPKE
jgi:hypothetical protein